MKTILDAGDEVVPEDGRVGVFTLLAQTSLHELILALHWHQLFVVFAEQTRNFTSRQKRIDSLKERLSLNFGVSHEEGDVLTAGASRLKQSLHIVVEVRLIVGLRQGDLELVVLGNRGSQASQRLLSRAAHTDQHSVATR